MIGIRGVGHERLVCQRVGHVFNKPGPTQKTFFRLSSSIIDGDEVAIGWLRFESNDMADYIAASTKTGNEREDLDNIYVKKANFSLNTLRCSPSI